MNIHHTGFSTRAVHSGLGFNHETGAVMPPLFLTSTFENGNPGGFDYTRSGNPNFQLLDRTIASLENARFATSFGSGVSAITAVISTLNQGDVVVAEENVYGCTYRLFEQVFKKFGVQAVYLDLSREENIPSVSECNPALVWLESPTNPLLKIIDIEAICQQTEAPVLVDNTFASPYLQQPLELGAALSLSSTTKFINGHSDCLAGTVATNDTTWHDKLVFAQKALGLQPSPFDAWLTCRGARTLALRMDRHCSNAMDIASWLEKEAKVSMVRYPGLKSHPQYNLAQRQMGRGSGLLLLELKADLEETLLFCRNLTLFTLAESLGGVESLICHPASMTHASVPADVRRATGISDGMIRLSIGIEDVEDLKQDLSHALEQLPS